MVGLQTNGFPERNHGFPRLALPLMEPAQIVVALGMIWLKGHHRLVSRQRAVQVLLQEARVAQIVMSLDVARPQANRFLVSGHRLIQLPLLLQGYPKIVVSGRVFRNQVDNSAKAGLCLGQISLFLENIAQVVVGIGMAGRERDRLADKGHRLLALAPLMSKQSEKMTGIGLIGASLQNAAVKDFSFGQPARPVQVHPQTQRLLQTEALLLLVGPRLRLGAHAGLNIANRPDRHDFLEKPLRLTTTPEHSTLRRSWRST